MKIFLLIIEDAIEGKCAISGKKVSFEGRAGFFVDNDQSQPVAPKVALEQGFTMTKQTLKVLEEMLENGHKYQEVQESAHSEFDKLY